MMSIEMAKSIFTTVVLMLAITQSIAGLRLRGYLKSLALPIRYLRPWHRWGGDATLVLTLTVALLCVSNFTFGTYSPRVPIHAALGTLAPALMFTKVIIARRWRTHLRLNLILGATAGLSVLGIFATTALWYFWSLS